MTLQAITGPQKLCRLVPDSSLLDATGSNWHRHHSQRHLGSMSFSAAHPSTMLAHRWHGKNPLAVRRCSGDWEDRAMATWGASRSLDFWAITSLYRRKLRTPSNVAIIAMASGGRSCGVNGASSPHSKMAALSGGTSVAPWKCTWEVMFTRKNHTVPDDSPYMICWCLPTRHHPRVTDLGVDGHQG